MVKKNTKHALLMSVLSLLLCCSMLIGTTFAWFTDEVKSGVNKITAGNLDVEVYYGKDAKPEKDKVTNTTENLFTDVNGQPVLWEPGVVAYTNLNVVNEGTLELKYQFAINFENENFILGTGAKLSQVLKVAFLENPVSGTREEILAAAKGQGVLLSSLLKSGTLAADGNKVYGVVIYWEPSAQDNNWNVQNGAQTNDGEALHIDLGLKLIATQKDAEQDSFGPDYDENAPKLFIVNGDNYKTAELALAAAKAGDKVYFSAADAPIVLDKAVELTISNCNIVAGEGENAITVNADATINVENGNVLKGGKNGDGIYVAENVTLTLTGSGNLYTSGNEEKEYFRASKDGVTYGENISNTTDATFANTCGSGIYVAGDIVIDGLAGLVAKGYGALNDQTNSGFGIGGTTDSIVIKNSTVNYARGGFVCANMFIPGWAGHFYGKTEPTGAPAIGSMTQGAEISIYNSTIVKAEGGSKGAGIGARYHTGVTVTITDSDVTAIGGNASAGIGGSRVDGNPQAHHAITVVITNSKVNATGGDYAAGIGSGYNTYADRMASSPATTVTIDAASEIIAKGGMLGAGIGTGHNVLNFVGDIKCDTTNVKAGYNVDDCCHGALCSDAEDVGLGAYKVEALHNKIADGLYQDKTDTTKYYVYNANGLVAFADSVNQYSNYEYPYEGEVVNLMNDIDLGGMEWTPIGDYRFSANRFCGTFDGQDHTISNFKITKKTDKNDSNKSSYGFFGNVEGTVKNLTIDNATVHSYAYTGALIGRLNGGAVQNCHVKNSSVKCSYWQAGGMIGQLNDGCVVSGCTITNSTITGAAAIGGLVGPITAANAAGTDTLLFENCSVVNCDVIQEGSFGSNYDKLFGGMFADVDVADNRTDIDKCCVENTTVKGTDSAVLFNTVSGSKVYIDGVPVVGTNDALKTVNGGNVALVGTVDLGGATGNYLTLTEDTTVTGGTIKGTGWTGELNYAVNASSGNIVFDGVTFDTTNWTTEGWAGWGISVNVNGTANVTFKNCTFKGTQCPIYQSGADSVITLENCKFESTSVAIQCEIYSGDFSLGQDLIVKGCDFTGVADVLHIYDHDKNPSSEAIAQYLTDNGNIFTGVCKQTCK